jgi:tight adherence protein B
MNVIVILLVISLIGILGFLAVIYRLYTLNSKNRLKGRLDNIEAEIDNQPSRVLITEPISQTNRYEGARGKISDALAFLSSSKLRQKMASAYWPISDIEFILLRIVITLVGLFLGWSISHGILGGLGLALLCYLIPGIVLDRSIVKRRKKFQEQLVDFLDLIKGAILAGNSLPQALDLAVRETPAPASEEFNQVLREMKFGIPLDEALHNLMVRMQGEDLQIIVTAIIINNQMGGNLSTILEATINTIRDRIQLFGEVRSLTSYSRFVSVLITFLPFILALFLYLLNPKYFDTVKTSLISQIILGLAVIGMIIGNITMRLIMRIRI